jgi:tetratricopeptide (TPR) repeat protein
MATPISNYTIELSTNTKRTAVSMMPPLTSLTNKGIALLNSGKVNESMTYFDKALAIDPNDVNTLTQKGIALIFLNKPNQSISYLDKALALNPNDVNTLTQKGLALSRLAQYNESIVYFDRALSIDPKYGVAIKEKADTVGVAAAAANATALTNKGIALLTLGRYNESIPYFNKALAIEPTNSFALAGKKLDLSALNKTNIIAASTSTAQTVPLQSTFGYYFGNNVTATPIKNATSMSSRPSSNATGTTMFEKEKNIVKTNAQK